MKTFKFRLQKVLEYRHAMEQWAQDAYLETRVARLEGEAALEEVHRNRAAVLNQPAVTLEERKHLELVLQTLDEDEKAKRTVIEVLTNEEEKALEAWHEKKRELEVINKLRERAFEEWKLDQTRKEQAALDEWAVLKRGA